MPYLVEKVEGMRGVFIPPFLGHVALQEEMQRAALVPQGPAQEICAVVVVVIALQGCQLAHFCWCSHLDEQAEIYRLHQVAVVFELPVVEFTIAGVGRYALFDFGAHGVFKGGEVPLFEQVVHHGIKLFASADAVGICAMQGQLLIVYGRLWSRFRLCRGGGGPGFCGGVFCLAFLQLTAALGFFFGRFAACFFLGSEAFPLCLFCGKAFAFCFLSRLAGQFFREALVGLEARAARGFFCLAFVFFLLVEVIPIVPTATKSNEQ